MVIRVDLELKSTHPKPVAVSVDDQKVRFPLIFASEGLPRPMYFNIAANESRVSAYIHRSLPKLRDL